MRTSITILVAPVLSLLMAAPSLADFGDQLSKLVPEDGDEHFEFGRCVASNADIVLVGAPEAHNESGADSGAVYIFETTSGRQIAKLLASDGESDDQFGISVALSGTIAVVGAWRDDDNGEGSGSAYLFDIATGRELGKLLAIDGDPGDRFGKSVAVSESTAIVGARWDQDNGPDSGSAYLFDITTGRQIAKLLPHDGAENHFFGLSVGISGPLAIVGAWGDQELGQESGAAYLFDAVTGRQIAKLLPEDGAEGDQFGIRVAISGPTAIVGAYSDDDNGDASGSAYLFDSSTGCEITKLLPEDGAVGDFFGYTVAINGTTALVGAWRDDDNGENSGSAYLFSVVTGQQIAKLLPDDGAPDDNFGQVGALDDALAIVGVYKDDDNGTSSGSAYIFDAAYCVADVTGDTIVGPADLAIILGNWGPVPPNDPIADLNDDGEVGPADLAIVLGNWGPCP